MRLSQWTKDGRESGLIAGASGVWVHLCECYVVAMTLGQWIRLCRAAGLIAGTSMSRRFVREARWCEQRKWEQKKTGIFSQAGFASDVRLGTHFGAILGSLFPSLSSAQFRAHEFRATCFTYKGSAQFRAPWPGTPPPPTAPSGQRTSRRPPQRPHKPKAVPIFGGFQCWEVLCRDFRPPQQFLSGFVRGLPKECAAELVLNCCSYAFATFSASQAFSGASSAATWIQLQKHNFMNVETQNFRGHRCNTSKKRCTRSPNPYFIEFCNLHLYVKTQLLEFSNRAFFQTPHLHVEEHHHHNPHISRHRKVHFEQAQDLPYLFLQCKIDVASGVTLRWLVGQLCCGLKVASGATLLYIYIYIFFFCGKVKTGPGFGSFKVKNWSKLKAKNQSKFFLIFKVFRGHVQKHK